MKRLDGQVALITGAANGIGRGCALRLANEGAALALVDREDEALAELAAELRANGRQVFIAALDCTDPEDASGFVADTEKHFGKIDILINNVGQSAREEKSTFLESTEAVWRFVLEVNLLTTMRFSRLAAPGMVQRGHGRIINMASESAVIAPVGSHDYAAAKAGIMGFTRAIARELAPSGVTVNCILPGPIHTRALATSTDPVSLAAMANIPVGFVGEPEDVAGVAAMLASVEGRYITGQSIIVNGGRWWL